MYDSLDDIELIRIILQGQQSAYSVIVSRYEQYVFTLVMRFVNNRELAEELSQDIFVKAYRFLADFKGNSKFSTWLYTIVNSSCLSHLRKKKDETILLDSEKLQIVADKPEKPSDNLEQKTQKQIINSAIKQLPESDANIITLFYLAEQSLEEIGVITGMTPGNVKIKLFRARLKLKEIFEKHYKTEIAL